MQLPQATDAHGVLGGAGDACAPLPGVILPAASHSKTRADSDTAGNLQRCEESSRGAQRHGQLRLIVVDTLQLISFFS